MRRLQLQHIWVHLLLVLFMGYYAGATLFPHVHNENGRIIVHSHPYSGSAGAPQHQHSVAQVQHIAQLSLVLLLLVAPLALPCLRLFQTARLSELSRPSHSVLYVQSYPLRGPPSL